MSVKYIGKANAKAGKSEELKEFVNEYIIPALTASDGCISCNLFNEAENPDRFILIEEWDTIESHTRATESIPTEATEIFMKLVNGTPTGRHYNLIYNTALHKVD